MPEALKFENEPGFFSESHIEPFHEEYVPGSSVLCQEANNGSAVYFQMPTPAYHRISVPGLVDLKRRVQEWWQAKGM